MPKINVLTIGAGLGGLCLAQALRKANINVAVFERDSSPWDRQIERTRNILFYRRSYGREAGQGCPQPQIGLGGLRVCVSARA